MIFPVNRRKGAVVRAKVVRIHNERAYDADGNSRSVAYDNHVDIYNGVPE